MTLEIILEGQSKASMVWPSEREHIPNTSLRHSEEGGQDFLLVQIDHALDGVHQNAHHHFVDVQNDDAIGTVSRLVQQVPDVHDGK